MENPILTIQDLFFRYETANVLEDVSLSISSQEFVAIFGPNGGGKTTLLKLIMGFLTPKKGSVQLFGAPPQQTRHQIGYVPQTLKTDRSFPISVLEVVMMGCLFKLDFWGRYPKQTREKALIALERVGLLGKANASFGTLSGGETQRVLIARAIIDTPKLLLLDEPTASVDPEAEDAILSLLLELNQDMTIMMVTHDLQTIINKAKRLLCVHRKVTSLKTQEVCEHFALGLYHTPMTPKKHFNF
ncbi:MAG: ABC transporter ATP-binding protein [Chlamydiota bacterium]